MKKNKKNQKGKTLDRLVVVQDKTWGVLLFFTDFVCPDGILMKAETPTYSILMLLDLKGAYRENKRPFETTYEFQARSHRVYNFEVMSREEAEADKRLESLQYYWNNIDERVALYWDGRKAESCTSEMVPSDEKIPMEARMMCKRYSKPLCGFELAYSVIGLSPEAERALLAGQ
jgi:hypothetical protein